MINYLRSKLKRRKLKRTFKEYGHTIDSFSLPKEGEVKFAQWQHPFEQPKAVTQENVDFYRQFVKEGDLAIDVGAHGGDTTVPMALAVGKKGCVLGIEPNQYVF